VSLSRYKVIADIAQAITSSIEYEEVLASVAEQAAVAFDISECCLYEHVSQTGTAIPRAIWSSEFDPENETFIGTALPLAGEPAMQRVMTERVMVETRIDDPLLSAADRAWMEKWHEMSTLYVPLVFGREAIGCLELIEKRYVRPFTD
jgi:transcriptional regulator with GAF, ATPase, and Fis domain